MPQSMVYSDDHENEELHGKKKRIKAVLCERGLWQLAYVWFAQVMSDALILFLAALALSCPDSQILWPSVDYLRR